MRTPVYDHLSLLATYRGTVNDGAERVEVDGLCTVEYARCVTPQALFRRPVSPRWKLPVDFFTHHVINLDERTQLLLTDVRAAGAYSFEGAFRSRAVSGTGYFEWVDCEDR